MVARILVCIGILVLVFGTASAVEGIQGLQTVVATPGGSRNGTPVTGSNGLLATVQAQQSATAEAKTATADASTAASATAQAGLLLTATSEARTATSIAQTAVANAIAVATQNAELQTALIAQATSQAEAEGVAKTAQAQIANAHATITAQASEIAGWEATGTSIALPTATPTATPSPTPSPTIVPTLYRADTESGFEEWEGRGWKLLNGMLVFDGTGDSDDKSVIQSPYQPRAFSDYAVEAEIQVVRGSRNSLGSGFGLFVRREGARSGYSAGSRPYRRSGWESAIWSGVESEVLTKKDSSDLKQGWHVYRIEVQGNEIRFLLDGKILLTATDNRSLEGGQVGLWADAPIQINVRSFTVTNL